MYSDGSFLLPIPKMTRVFYDVYADFPVAGLTAGRDFAYATDRRTLYYWDGAAWVELSIYAYSGAFADIPAAADLPNGSLYYGTDTTLLYQVQAGAWVTITAAAYTDADAIAAVGAEMQVIRKTADEIVNNSIVLQNDDHLLLPVAANEIWELEILLRITNFHSTPDFKYAFALPAAAAFWGIDDKDWAAVIANSEFLIADDLTNAHTIVSGVFCTDGFIIIKGIYVGGGNAGNIQLQWAQNTAHASNTTVLANSYIKATKLN